MSGEGNQKQTPPVKKKKRSRKEKAEASNLRNLIATKEYELQRTEKLIQKKGSLGAAQKLASSSSPVSAGGPYSAAASAQEIMHVLNSLQCDLRDLKDSYHKLTGISFESSSKRRFLPRMRGKEKLSREDRQERFDAAFAAALATGDHPASPNVVRHSLDRLAKEKQIFEARNQLTVTCSENESGDEKPYPRMWKVSLSAEKANRTEIRTAFRRGIGGQNILVIALYIFAMAVSVLFEKNVIVMTAYIDFLLLSSGYSCSMICDKIDCAVNTAAIVIRNILKLLYSNLAGIFHRFWLASNAFMDQLLTPT